MRVYPKSAIVNRQFFHAVDGSVWVFLFFRFRRRPMVDMVGEPPQVPALASQFGKIELQPARSVYLWENGPKDWAG